MFLELVRCCCYNAPRVVASFLGTSQQPSQTPGTLQKRYEHRSNADVYYDDVRFNSMLQQHAIAYIYITCLVRYVIYYDVPSVSTKISGQ